MPFRRRAQSTIWHATGDDALAACVVVGLSRVDPVSRYALASLPWLCGAGNRGRRHLAGDMVALGQRVVRTQSWARIGDYIVGHGAGRVGITAVAHLVDRALGLACGLHRNGRADPTADFAAHLDVDAQSRAACSR